MLQDSNFLRVYKIAHKDRTEFLKSLILIVAIAVILLFASLLSVGLIKNFKLNFLIGAGTLWLMAFALLPIFFLTASRLRFYSAAIIFSIIPFASSLMGKGWNNILFFIIGGISAMLITSGWRMQTEAKNLITLNLVRIISKGSFLLSFALLVIISTLLYTNKTNFDLTKYAFTDLNFVLPKNLQSYSIPDIKFGGTIDEILKTYIANIEKQTNNSALLSPLASAMLLKQTKTSLSQMISIPISGTETIAGLTGSFLKSRWQSFGLSVKFILLLTLFLLISSAVAAFNYIFSILLILFSWFFLKIFIMSKYLQIKKIGIEKEEISFV